MITRKTSRRFRYFYNSKIKKDYYLLKDNEEINIGAVKVRAIDTSGHTPGSMSYLVNDSLLFVGDAFEFIDGKVSAVSHRFSMDMEKQAESIKKLAQLKNIRLAFAAHRGYTQNFDNAIRDWR